MHTLVGQNLVRGSLCHEALRGSQRHGRLLCRLKRVSNDVVSLAFCCTPGGCRALCILQLLPDALHFLWVTPVGCFGWHAENAQVCSGQLRGGRLQI